MRRIRTGSQSLEGEAGLTQEERARRQQTPRDPQQAGGAHTHATCRKLPSQLPSTKKHWLKGSEDQRERNRRVKTSVKGRMRQRERDDEGEVGERWR